MIFVTVGTTHFDPLIEVVDTLVADGQLAGPIIFQIGSGRYEPKNGSFFRFKPSIDEELDAADLVITHGGITVLSLLAQRKRFVAVANTALADDHQTHYLAFLEKQSTIVWTNDLGAIGECVAGVLDSEPARLEAPSLVSDLLEYFGVVTNES
ncbi:glycosyltransferase [Denitromonas ohlonensis]|uniref:Glycosyltransferase n=2 Tax=Denitromonas TaxID=139331 RepID=A0A557RCK4_9RHOO|nr:glycosyltransferase [Denitromonas ohlonensis]TVO62890.1 glycosyltransferase [Denitromonas ohlonensis]TVO74993.1 glycosyltransferase [Denitromonas ohlonensis]